MFVGRFLKNAQVSGLNHGSMSDDIRSLSLLKGILPVENIITDTVSIYHA